ncbi:MAG: Holliday junction branch migration protein RuvA [Candidatus Izemoplasma sp.]
MYSYLKGNVTYIEPNKITLEINNVGFEIITPNPYSFTKDQELTVFVFQNVKEDSILLYGFKTMDEKRMFIKLLSVKGIGPKSALAILATGSVDDIVNAIEASNVHYLIKFPGIGPKASQQIILDLKGKIEFNEISKLTNTSILEVEEALSSLGYKAKEIKKVIPLLDSTKGTSELIRDSLKLMLK